MLLPSRQGGPATTAETYEDLAGQGRRYTALGLAMAVCCFSLTGIPLTIGFFGKILLIWPAFEAGALWLVIITMINAAISAAYYLRIVGTMFLRPEPGAEEHPASPRIEDPRFGAPAAALEPPPRNLAVNIAIALSVAGTLLFGSVWPATQMLHTQTMSATRLEPTMPMRFIDDENEEQEEEEEAVTTRVDVSE
jgi:NADH:ubiquinone oxidoreductase subunit 2 (subunit N)